MSQMLLSVQRAPDHYVRIFHSKFESCAKMDAGMAYPPEFTIQVGKTLFTKK